MALRVLTNERDKDGKLIEQLIVTQQEEDYYKKLSGDIFDEKLKAEYKAMGLPQGNDAADELRGRIFRTLVFFHKIGRWVLVTIATLAAGKLISEVLDRIEIGIRP